MIARDTPASLGQGRARLLRTALAGTAAVATLSSLYLAQNIVARGYQGEARSVELFARAACEWSTWAALLPFILRFAGRVPVGPDHPRRNTVMQLLAGGLAIPAWAAIVALPIALLGLPLWGQQVAGNVDQTIVAAMLQRGPYIAICYWLIIGLATAHRLAIERAAAASAAESAQRALVAAQLDDLAGRLASDQLADRLNSIRVAMERSPEAAETATLELAADLQRTLLRAQSPGA